MNQSSVHAGHFPTAKVYYITDCNLSKEAEQGYRAAVLPEELSSQILQGQPVPPPGSTSASSIGTLVCTPSLPSEGNPEGMCPDN
jgi:hypothetical protein